MTTITDEHEKLHLLHLCDFILRTCNSTPIKQVDHTTIEYIGLRVNIDTCINNLVNDKYIEYDYPMINITPNGQLFIESGGYIQKLKDNLSEKNLQSSYEQLMRTSTSRIAYWTAMLTLATWLAALGTIGLLVWELYKHFFLVKV